MLVESFPAVYTKEAQILILGSMPGRASLDANQYYAHPRNLFWSFIAASREVILPDSYDSRVAMLQSQHLAVWDVLKFCEREGSLDVNIRRYSEHANDLESLIEQLSKLRRICFNGQKACQSFKRHFKHMRRFKNIEHVLLPSSSPANASQSYEKKLRIWRASLHCDF